MRSAFIWDFDPYRPLFFEDVITCDHVLNLCLGYFFENGPDLLESQAKMFLRVAGTLVDRLVDNLVGELLVLVAH